MQKAKNLLLKKGLPEDNYHQEAFGVAATTAKPEKSVEIEFNGFKLMGNNQQTLLEQLEFRSHKTSHEEIWPTAHHEIHAKIRLLPKNTSCSESLRSSCECIQKLVSWFEKLGTRTSGVY